MGNNLIYRTREPEKIAEQLEERVRADLGSSTKVPYEIHDTRDLAQGGVLGDMGRMMVGGRLEPIATIVFALPWHGTATLAVIASRVGLTAQCVSLLYQVDFDRQLDAPITIDKKTFASSGTEASRMAAKLNAIPELAKRVDKVLRERTVFSALVHEQQPHFSIEPEGPVARMWLRTLARPTGLLMSGGTTDAGEVMSIAQAIEPALH